MTVFTQPLVNFLLLEIVFDSSFQNLPKLVKFCILFSFQIYFYHIFFIVKMQDRLWHGKETAYIFASANIP